MGAYRARVESGEISAAEEKELLQDELSTLRKQLADVWACRTKNCISNNMMNCKSS